MENILLDGFKWCEGFEGLYSINIDGKVCSHHFGKIKEIKGTINKYIGYRTFYFTKNGEYVTKYMHRLLAEAFIPNPENKPCINHIDHNRANNAIDNLEWCTYSENILAMLKMYPDHYYNRVQEKLPNDELKFFVLNGARGSYLSKSPIVKRLKEQPDSFWEDLGVPKELLDVKTTNKRNSDTLYNLWIDIYNTLTFVNKDLPLNVVAELTNKDFTLISKIRSGTRWVKEAEIYNKYKDIPTFLKFITNTY